jgi:transcriptional regulator with XRE-family HTH domain
MLAEKLRELRERANMTQQDVATRADLSWSMVAQIEQGRKPDLRVSTLIRLAEALGVPAVELFEAFVEAGTRPRRKRGRGEPLPADKPENPGRRRGRPAGAKDKGNDSKSTKPSGKNKGT